MPVGDPPSNTPASTGQHGNAVHVRPVEDAIGHEADTSAPDCVCGPDVFPAERDDGTVYALIVHRPLDCGESEWVADEDVA